MTECLRLEQELAEDDDDEEEDDNDGSGGVVRRRKDVGRSCMQFLDAFESKLLIPTDDSGGGMTTTTMIARQCPPTLKPAQ